MSVYEDQKKKNAMESVMGYCLLTAACVAIIVAAVVVCPALREDETPIGLHVQTDDLLEILPGREEGYNFVIAQDGSVSRGCEISELSEGEDGKFYITVVLDSRPRGVFDPAVNGAQYRTLCDLTRRLFRSFDLQEVAFAYDDPMLEVVNVAGLELAALADKANARRTSL
jgi:hypothetical protein